MPRSHDGRQRFQLTMEIRELIKADTKKQIKAAVKEAFARHTNWGKIAGELRIDRPQSAPVFSINGRSTTSDEEAITAIAKHIETTYITPSQPMRIPPWNQGHGIRALDIHEAVGMAAMAAKKGKASGGSGLSNACIKSLKDGGNRVYCESHTGKRQSQERLPEPVEIIPRTVVAQERRQGLAHELQTVKHRAHDVKIPWGNFQPANTTTSGASLRPRTARVQKRDTPLSPCCTSLRR